MQDFIDKTANMKHMERSHRFAKNHRALGLGVMGYHAFLQKNMIPFESMEAKLWNTQIFKNLQAKAIKASENLAKLLGESPVCEGTGRRNTTLLAIAPTTSSSAILGQTSPGIEPYSSNYYKVGLAKGNFMRKNKFLKEVLASKNEDTDETWKSILVKDGSVQHLDFLSDKEKDVFKTFRELSQLEIIIQAATRQKYICQSQSLNLNIPPNAEPKDINALYIKAWELGVKGLYYQRSASVSQDMIRNIVSCASCEA
jgi:ribonucleoside-diphosphate reductase alpha chain